MQSREIKLLAQGHTASTVVSFLSFWNSTLEEKLLRSNFHTNNKEMKLLVNLYCKHTLLSFT